MFYDGDDERKWVRLRPGWIGAFTCNTSNRYLKNGEVKKLHWKQNGFSCSAASSTNFRDRIFGALEIILNDNVMIRIVAGDEFPGDPQPENVTKVPYPVTRKYTKVLNWFRHR